MGSLFAADGQRVVVSGTDSPFEKNIRVQLGPNLE